jgi:hypothetical protein
MTSIWNSVGQSRAQKVSFLCCCCCYNSVEMFTRFGYGWDDVVTLCWGAVDSCWPSRRKKGPACFCFLFLFSPRIDEIIQQPATYEMHICERKIINGLWLLSCPVMDGRFRLMTQTLMTLWRDGRGFPPSGSFSFRISVGPFYPLHSFMFELKNTR